MTFQKRLPDGQNENRYGRRTSPVDTAKDHPQARRQNIVNHVFSAMAKNDYKGLKMHCL
jgi:hypothetical protein